MKQLTVDGWRLTGERRRSGTRATEGGGAPVNRQPSTANPVLIALFVALALLACTKKSEQPAKPTYTIAVIPQGSTHEFWKSIHAGAVKAAQDEAASGVTVNLIWKGPMREDDREQQVQVVEGFLTQQVSGIVLALFDKNALVRPVEEAKRAGIPTVVIDSGLESQDPISFVASNNEHGDTISDSSLSGISVPVWG